MKTSRKISIVIPYHNAATTILLMLDSLITECSHGEEFIFVDDASTDNTSKIILKFVKNKEIKFKFIYHKHSVGLSKSYNDGIKQTTNDIVVLIHADVIVKKNGLSLLIKPLRERPHVVATYHGVMHPRDNWNQYNFWQKCFFDRHIDNTYFGLDGKFDAFRKSALKKVNYFDYRTFYRAGEDSDMVEKLKKIGLVIKTNALILHIHSKSPNFGIKDIIYKHAQYAEAQGALLRRYKIYSPVKFLSIYFRELLLIGLLIPYIQNLSIFLIIAYSILYNKNTLQIEGENLRKLLLPILNILLLFVSFYFTLRGYVYGKQKI